MSLSEGGGEGTAVPEFGVLLDVVGSSVDAV